MAQPYLLSNTQVLSADLGSSQTSTIVDIANAVGYSYQVVWSGGSGTTGSIIVEGSNDLETAASRTFSTIQASSVSTTSGSFLSNNSSTAYNYTRLRWNRTGGTGGTIVVRICLKNLA